MWGPKKKAFPRIHIDMCFLQKTGSKLVKFGPCGPICILTDNRETGYSNVLLVLCSVCEGNVTYADYKEKSMMEGEVNAECSVRAKYKERSNYSGEQCLFKMFPPI